MSLKRYPTDKGTSVATNRGWEDEKTGELYCERKGLLDELHANGLDKYGEPQTEESEVTDEEE